jgi:DNA-binding MurR/RpiR family transcriptional regulator
MLQVANYVLACPETIALGSVDSAASATGASPASLVRFCQFIGLTGFAQLREILRNELLRSLRIAREDHSRASDSHKLTLQRVVSLTIRALEELDGSLSEEALCDFIDVLKRAGTIFITGDGRCYPIAVVLHQMLGEMRIRSYLVSLGS